MSKGKGLAALTAVLICAVTVIGGTLAYFTAQDTAVNTFTVGAVDIDLSEPHWNAEEKHIISPGAWIAKDPTVRNTGVNAAYIRVRLVFSNFDVMQNIFGSSFAQASENGVIVGFDNHLWTIQKEYDEGDKHIVVLLLNTALAEESEAVVFTGLNIPSELNEELKPIMGQNVTLTAEADAIQADGFESAAEAFEHFSGK